MSACVAVSVLHSLIFVQNTERVQEREVSSDVLKVLLRDIPVMVMVIIPENRLSKDKKQITPNTLRTHIHTHTQKH